VGSLDTLFFFFFKSSRGKGWLSLECWEKFWQIRPPEAQVSFKTVLRVLGRLCLGFLASWIYSLVIHGQRRVRS
jgi:hypothetical protein